MIWKYNEVYIILKINGLYFLLEISESKIATQGKSSQQDKNILTLATISNICPGLV